MNQGTPVVGEEVVAAESCCFHEHLDKGTVRQPEAVAVAMVHSNWQGVEVEGEHHSHQEMALGKEEDSMAESVA